MSATFIAERVKALLENELDAAERFAASTESGSSVSIGVGWAETIAALAAAYVALSESA